ncbi:MAG: 3-deoxy-D-manno-octulosonic acid transferase [Limnohabitans sp.]|nr:3-deoxy-D-manno-octulosonic acid transferase [Limnohabitans sp.]
MDKRLKATLSLTLYSLLTRALQPWVRRKLARRGRAEPGYLHAIEERFGDYTQPQGKGYLWVHAVSLGETRAAAVLLKAVRAQWPDLPVLLTHGTATGREEGQRLLQPGDCQVWQPWDTPQAVAKFLAHFQPRVGLLMETEVWPNWVAACRRAGVPLILANARLSEKSLAQARRLAWLSRPSYAGLSAVWAQTEPDAQRLRSLGASVSAVMGNIKFDATPEAGQLLAGRTARAALDRPVALLASAREGEEALWSKAVWAHAKAQPSMQWLVVPRHPQRFDEVAKLLALQGWQVVRRSQQADASWPPASDPAVPTVWLGDTLGEMPYYFGLADVALLGGSFEKLGGQNLIEAAACACPVIMGPHTFNFLEAAEAALQAGAAQRVEDMGQAVATAWQWVNDAAGLAQRAAASELFANSHRGAAQRSVQALRAWLDLKAT